MDLLSGAILLPLVGAAMHPLLGRCVQNATSVGVRMTITVSVANLVTACLFLLYLNPQGGWALSGKDWWAIANGLAFFAGQWFSIQSVKSGDLAVHSSALGIKVLIVGCFSFLVGLEVLSWNLLLGVILAVAAVFLVSGGSAAGWRKHRETVWLTLLACFFFGLNDFMTGWQAREIGADRWLMLMMATTGIISIVLLVQRRQDLNLLRDSKAARNWTFGSGLLMGTQALLVNLAFSKYGQPTLSNVAFSTRGVMAVLFLYLIGQRSAPGLFRRQIAGAALMVLALVIVLSP